jgi:hypothetical protein
LLNEYLKHTADTLRYQVGTIDIGAFENTTNLGLENYIEDHLIMYPNPGNSTVYFNISEFESIQFYSTTGQLVLESAQNEIDVTSLQNGLYIVKIDHENVPLFLRFLKE